MTIEPCLRETASTPSHFISTETATDLSLRGDEERLAELVAGLKNYGIQHCETHGETLPTEALMHDRAAIIPALVVSPRSEWGVQKVIELIRDLNLIKEYPVSVRSGGHGYFNGASCSGIMINLSFLSTLDIQGTTMLVEPGCILARVIDTLRKKKKAVPHGDCFGVAAGGHFLTAGWDIALARRYGLGCQSVIGGRIVLWDGTILDVDESTHPKLLYAMRGGAAAGVGVVTKVRLELLEQPESVSWRFMSLSNNQLQLCVAHRVFESAFNLPRDISVAFRFHFTPSQLDPVCTLSIVSLSSATKTLEEFSKLLGADFASLVGELSEWHEGPLQDLRLVPASEGLKADPGMLAEVTPEMLQASPLTYWSQPTSSREMARSYLASVSHWVVAQCDPMLMDLFEAFETVPVGPLRSRMYAFVVQGGGRIAELQHRCSMPLGVALARFETHWDEADDEAWSRKFTDDISKIIESKSDTGMRRPFRGDIWQAEQGYDETLRDIFKLYDRRSLRTGARSPRSSPIDG